VPSPSGPELTALSVTGGPGPQHSCQAAPATEQVDRRADQIYNENAEGDVAEHAVHPSDGRNRHHEGADHLRDQAEPVHYLLGVPQLLVRQIQHESVRALDDDHPVDHGEEDQDSGRLPDPRYRMSPIPATGTATTASSVISRCLSGLPRCLALTVSQ